MGMLHTEVREGAYYDSIVLMQLQSALADLPGVIDSGVVMATEANLALLRASGLLDGEPPAAGPDDLLLVVKAEDDSAARNALAQIDELLTRRRAEAATEGYRPRSLVSALKQLPHARWVLVSVPGRFAARVADESLDHGLNVFLYSDNVSLDEEKGLKAKAAERGLLVLGPDCGTAIVGGVGFGFANRVRRGAVGLVGASGTGLQAVMSHIHTLGGGISQAIGTGGRDLSTEVGAITARQALEVLARDPETQVIVLISKPPSPAVARELLAAAQNTGKRVVVYFIGYPHPGRRIDALRFASSLEGAAALAVELLETTREATVEMHVLSLAAPGRLRGLFSGGTLAYEALQALRVFLEPLYSNIALDGVEPLEDPTQSQGDCVVDLGDDALTVGRLHPMIDPEICLRRIRQEAEDPEVGTLLLDVVLGEGAHPDPASLLAPVIREVKAGRKLQVLVVVVGTDLDPQGLEDQIIRLQESGARVFRDVSEAVADMAQRWTPMTETSRPVPLENLAAPVAAINVGLETFHESLLNQGAEAVHMDWRPPAGGNETMMALLERMKSR